MVCTVIVPTNLMSPEATVFFSLKKEISNCSKELGVKLTHNTTCVSCRLASVNNSESFRRMKVTVQWEMKPMITYILVGC